MRSGETNSTTPKHRCWYTVAALVAVLSLLSCAPSERRPHLVVVTPDTFRADNLVAFGGTQVIAPFLEQVAVESTVFSRAYTTMGTTFPAHASLFTGLHPFEHGVRWNGDDLGQEHVTLAQLLADNGYQTAAFVGHTAMLSRAGLDQGFEVTSDPPGAEAQRRWAPRVNRLLERWLGERKRSSKPLFLWLHYFDMHTPYGPSDFSRQAQEQLDYTGPYQERTGYYDLIDWDVPSLEQPHPGLEALYRGQVVELDRQVQRALSWLDEELGEYLLLIVADHGEMLGEHGDLMHSKQIWEPVIRVPLMIRLPTQRQQRVVRDSVSVIDVTPSLLEYLDMEPPSQQPFVQLFRLAAGQQEAVRPVFADTRAAALEKRVEKPGSPLQAGIHGDIKVVSTRGGGYRQWDLSADPLELFPVAVTRDSSAFTGLVHRYATAVGAAPLSREALPESTLRELRSMGYLNQ